MAVDPADHEKGEQLIRAGTVAKRLDELSSRLGEGKEPVTAGFG
jgi:hypothetical protein